MQGMSPTPQPPHPACLRTPLTRSPAVARLLVGLCMGLCLGLAARGLRAQPSPQDPAAAPRELRTVAGISEYQFANGLRLLLMPVSSHALTRVTVTYPVGSRHEGAGEAGMAHLLEHMTFRGSRQAPDLAAELQQMQVRWNGSTTLDRTNYLSSFSPNTSTLQRVLQLEAARMQDALLSAADFAKEKPIVLNEMGLRANALGQQLNHALQAAAFRQHPYGRPVIGFRGDIDNLSLQRLQAFYARHYRPSQAVVMISGAFDPAAALAAAQQALGGLTEPLRPASPADPTEDIPPEPTQQAPRLSTLPSSQTALAVGFRIPGMAHADAAALMVLGQLLQASSQRWVQEPPLQGQAHLLQSLPLSRDPHLLGLALLLPHSASDTPASRQALESLEDRWLLSLGQFADPQHLGDALVQRVAQGTASQLRRQLQDPEQAAQLISHAIGAGDWRLPFKLLDALPGLRAYDVRRVAAHYVRPENRMLVRAVTDPSLRSSESGDAPQGFFASLFAKPAEVATVKDPSQGMERIKSSGALLSPAQSQPGGAGRGEALPFDPDPAALEARVQRLQLPSGMQLALLPKPNPFDEVTLLLQLRWGSPEAMATLQAWRPLAAMLEDGAGRRDAAQIRQLRQQLHADLRLHCGPQGLQLRLSTRRNHLLAALDLLRDLLREPRLSDSSFERVQGAALATLEAATRESVGTVQERLRRYLNEQQGLQAGSPDYVYSAAELLQIWRELRPEQVRDFHRRFFSARQAQVAVVGAMPDSFAEALAQQLEALFGDWQRPEPPAFVPPQPRHQPVMSARFMATQATGPAQQENSAQVLMLHELAMSRQAPDYSALLLGTRLLAGQGEAHGSRLADRLRQQEAISYAVSAKLHVPPWGDRARLSLQASAAPAQLARLESAMREEIQALLQTGPSPAELERVRRQLLADLRQQRSQDAVLAADLLAHFDTQRNFLSEQGAEEARLLQATPEQVLQALRQALATPGWVTLITGAPSNAQ